MDIVQRLRRMNYKWSAHSPTASEAAKEIESLRQQLADQIAGNNAMFAAYQNELYKVVEQCARICETSDRYRGEYFAYKIRSHYEENISNTSYR